MPATRFSPDVQANIRKLYQGGMSFRQIATKMNAAPLTIKRICRGLENPNENIQQLNTTLHNRRALSKTSWLSKADAWPEEFT